MGKIANVGPILQLYSVAACTLLSSPKLSEHVDASCADILLMFVASVYKFIPDITLN